MNDHDAMTAINEVLDAWLNLDTTAVDAMHVIATISSRNQADREAAK